MVEFGNFTKLSIRKFALCLAERTSFATLKNLDFVKLVICRIFWIYLLTVNLDDGTCYNFRTTMGDFGIVSFPKQYVPWVHEYFNNGLAVGQLPLSYF